jgi:ABC-type branched-subunit amino acid transport system ATPase component
MFLQRRALLIEYLFGLPRARASARGMDARAKELLELLGLAHLAARPAALLSTAQRRLLEIARALGSEPGILLLDEPASGLSRVEVEGLGATLRALRSMGMAIVLVEHNVPFVLSVADSVTVLDRGRRIAVGTPGEVQRDPQVIASYLGEQLGGRVVGDA